MNEKKPKKATRRKKERVIVTRGKNKEAIARARAMKGSGRITINGLSIEAYTPQYLQNVILVPRMLAGDCANDMDVTIQVSGGGVVGQAKAATTALARVYVEKEPTLKEAFVEYDRNLLIEDSRRVEPKKYKGRKARARFQKSYR